MNLGLVIYVFREKTSVLSQCDCKGLWTTRINGQANIKIRCSFNWVMLWGCEEHEVRSSADLESDRTRKCNKTISNVTGKWHFLFRLLLHPEIHLNTSTTLLKRGIADSEAAVHILRIRLNYAGVWGAHMSAQKIVRKKVLADPWFIILTPACCHWLVSTCPLRTGCRLNIS